MEESSLHSPVQESESDVSAEIGPDGKVIRKTYLEIREEARRSVLSGNDSQKYETLEQEERDFVDAACLFEFKSQKVAKIHRKIKLREMLLCRDVAQAYCSGKDLVGQYSEGKRILKNSESGSDTVKFVLARKICSMLEKTFNLYSAHPRTFVSADLHKSETELLNYIYRLGRLIREPLTQAKRIYVKLKERTGWEIPAAAFSMAEGCDVPQLFFNRYSDSSQLLLKDPQKPFRSDNTSPPLKLDFRIKNAVLIVAGENRFHLDKKKFDAVRESPAARSIMAKALHEAKEKISNDYRRNVYGLSDGLSVEEEINVRSVKEAAFNCFYGYTLKYLPNTAARADATELFIMTLMPEENDAGCKGFCKAVYPPDAVQDDDNPDYWSQGITRAYKLRRILYDVGSGTARLSMFPTKMNELLTEYLNEQLQANKKKLAAPFQARIKFAERKLQEFQQAHSQELEKADEIAKQIESIGQEHSRLLTEALSLISSTFKKSFTAETSGEKEQLIERIRPRLKDEENKMAQTIRTIKERYQALVSSYNNLAAQVKKIGEVQGQVAQHPEDPELAQASQQLFASLSHLESEGRKSESLADLRNLVLAQLGRIKAALDKYKQQYAEAAEIEKSLKKIIELIANTDLKKQEISGLRQKNQELEALFEEKQALLENIAQIKTELDECISRIDEEIEVNLET